ncbi:NF038120 family PEP-CTERM protein [Rugamonas sp.]|uniref:NF038120 family PEP-CTERM protein n=1 Tax=Rugamonas sp. TaxID=1926287 RepID=UPI0025F57914|nr:NF038120 family PEP-CTERM protein [Rugamonas sp.]
MIQALYLCSAAQLRRGWTRRIGQAGGAALLAAATMSAAHADATTIDFEHVSNVVTPALAAGDSIYAGRDQFSSQGYLATVADSTFAQSQDGYTPGLAGAIVDGGNAYNCDIIACPAGNASKYYSGLNDGSISFSRSDSHGFHLNSLDFAFVSPVYGVPDGVYGRLVISGSKVGGGTISTEVDFGGQNADGLYTFASWNAGAFGKADLSSVTISACLFDGAGGCVNSDVSANQAQFALDNVHLTSAVPEPAAWMMFGLGLALAAVARRRGAFLPNA